MVYLRAITPALCELLDDAATAPQTAAAVRAFGEQRLRSLVHTEIPSLLDNALWVFLISLEQLLQRQGAALHHDSTTASLPRQLQLPSSIATVQAAVRWYGGELDLPLLHSPAAGVGSTAHEDVTDPSSSPRAKAQAPPPTTHRSLFSDTPSTRHDAVRLDALLQHRHQAPVTAAASTTTLAATDSPGNGPANAKDTFTGPLATVQLGLEALSNPKRAAALRQPRSLALVVRNLAALWSLVYLCKELRARQLRQEGLLRGDAVTTAAAGPARAATVCFHDYDLLLPWDLVYAVLTDSSSAGSAANEATTTQKKKCTPLTMAAVAARCRALADRHAAPQSTCSEADEAGPQQSGPPPPISLVINPAVTVVGDNPTRLRKNARIDAIEAAANRYYYSLLATSAHGQEGRPSPSSTASTSTASAAAHHEALRSSLASVDLGDYGVLDPSRMHACVPLRATTTGFSAASSSAISAGSSGGDLKTERAAKSYALFLRDASIGFDIQIMAVTGAGVGYYLGYLRGLNAESCTLYAVVGLVAMMLVDAVLIMIRIGRQDEAARRSRARIRRQREKLEKEGERIVQAMHRAADSGEGQVRTTVDPARLAGVDAYTKKRQ
ncbi:hypothetical protein ABB37_08322 [Leptomonas pyrrhocoris]|uniref:Uncharacterized protein n=1 Tax=Leptomonas pyrrhocoris TaxID=157538 RepID=A0A0N0DSE0_LEPPY|nr:hypothetical protein ABB37_08322 [Leptomonas pyrrhocoris]KPA75798.1 hypothetical protein ABB37_08322 [Leptomonas pyrrhocoris]|eukprot:XP_015654237.1 hypothetical protein ABB37_08322 [Leptomonas pyrrhocoris]